MDNNRTHPTSVDVTINITSVTGRPLELNIQAAPNDADEVYLLLQSEDDMTDALLTVDVATQLRDALTAAIQLLTNGGQE